VLRRGGDRGNVNDSKHHPTTTKDTIMDKHFTAASKALDSILAESMEQTGNDLLATLAQVDDLIEQARGIKRAHVKAVRAAQSKASNEKRKVRVAAALAMYEAAQKSA